MNKSNKLLSQIVAFRSYAKHLPHLGRRESLEETINRNMSMHLEKFPKLSRDILKAYKQIHDLKSMPSMRSLQFGGEAILKNNTRIYNCSFLNINYERAFAESLYLLLCGVGVGYSVQKRHINSLPPIRSPKEESIYVASDSIEGWSECVDRLMSAYFYGGLRPIFDLSRIRPKGSLLVTVGAKAPGPEPLRLLLTKVEEILKKAIGRKLTTLEVHDIICIIADGVLAGGIRRCLPEDTLVYTTSGIKKIKNVMIGDRVYTRNSIRSVTNKFVQGDQSVSKIVTNGQTVYATKTHKIATLDSNGDVIFKKVEDLKNGDILLQNNRLIEGGNNLMPDVSPYNLRPEKSTTAKTLNRIELSEKTAWLIGLIQGDGYVHKRKHKEGGSSHLTIAFSSNEEDRPIVEKASKVLKEIGIEHSVNKVKNENTIKITVHHQALVEYLLDHVKKPKIQLEVPEFILTATADVRGAYLAGLMDSDGSIKNRPVILLNSVYEKFSEDIVTLYSSLGISGRLVRKARNKENWQDMTKIGLIGCKEKYNQLVGRYSAKGLIKVGNKQKGFNIPKSVVLNHLKMNKSIRKTWSSGSESMNYETYIELGGSLNMTPLHIKEIIHNFKTVPTYDIEVETDHEFFGDSVLTHNSATISLFDKDDESMLTAKHGEWWVKYPYRARANNSAVLELLTTTREEYERVFEACIKSNSGEPGFIWTNDTDLGKNPCCEISLNSNQFCNLSTSNLSGITSEKDFMNRVYASALLGTLQASYTNFPYLNHKWKEVTEREALLGVSFTGVADAGDWATPEVLSKGAKLVLEVNEKYAKKIGINLAARATAIKPEGSASCVLSSSSGIHARYADYYLRRVRMNKDDSLAKYLMSEIPELVEEDLFSNSGVVVTLPQSSPEGAITRDQETAADLFNRVKKYNLSWVRDGHRSGADYHNVSCTINYKPEDVDILRELMWNHRDTYSGISLLPFDGGTYKQAPFEACDKETYEKYSEMVKDIDLTKVIELEDNTDRIGELACAGGACEFK